MEVADRLLALPAAQVGVDGVALDRAGPDDRHLDHQVVEVLRARARQRLHLRARLDLEDAHGVGRLDHPEDVRDVLGQPVEVDVDGAVGLDVAQGIVDRAEHAQAEQVELDQLDRLDVALVVLDDHPAGHRRPLERRDVDQRRLGDEHAAGVDRQVTREFGDARGQLEPAFPRREADRGVGAAVVAS